MTPLITWRVAPPRAAPRRPTGAMLRTTLRGAVVGFVGLALLMAIFSVSVWAMASAARTLPAPAAFNIMAGVPFFAAMLGGISTALLVSQWVLMRRQAVARLAPGALHHLRRTMAWCLLPLWAWLAWPAAAAALRFAARVAEPGPGAVPAAWALVLFTIGLPALGMAAALCLMVLVRRPWLRTVLGLLPMLAVVGMNQLKMSQLQWLPGRDLWMAGLGVAGLAAALWAAHRAAHALSQPAALHTPGTTPAGLVGWQLGGEHTLPARRWHAMLLPAVTATRRDAALLVPALLVLVWWFDQAGMGWGLSVMLMIGLSASAAAPWSMGAWVSPRLAWLPGGVRRHGLAWMVWRQALQRGLPRVAVVGGLLLGLCAAVLRAPATEVATTALLGLGCAWFVGSATVALLPRCRSTLALQLTPWLATAVYAVVLLALAWWWGTAAEAGASAAWLSWAAGIFVASLALGPLLVAASARSWARYDWSRMPATAPALDMLLKQAARTA